MAAQVQAADDENISDPDGTELSGGSENASNMTDPIIGFIENLTQSTFYQISGLYESGPAMDQPAVG